MRTRVQDPLQYFGLIGHSRSPKITIFKAPNKYCVSGELNIYIS